MAFKMRIFGLIQNVLARPARHISASPYSFQKKKHLKSITMADEVKAITKQADAFCFDVDSTVITEESIDQLANFCGKGEEIAALTTKAMGGSMTFQESLRIRLDILKPTYEQLKNFIERHPPKLSPKIDTLIQRLQAKKVPVYLISGGFRSIIEPIATRLNIPHENVFANRMKFYFDGEFAGFDEDAPTSRSGGKAVIIDRLKQRHGHKKLVLVGDGATDLEACPPADAFIGYGGNIVRQNVKERTKWFVTDFSEVINLIG